MNGKNIHIKFGLIAGAAMAVTSLIIYITGTTNIPGVQFLSYVPFLIGVLMNANAFSKANEGFVTFGNIFGSCLKVAMIVTLIMVAYMQLSMLLYPGMKEKTMAAALEEMHKNKSMTDAQIEDTVAKTKKYFNVLLIAGAVFGTFVYGTVFSLIGGLIAKKLGERPNVIN